MEVAFILILILVFLIVILFPKKEERKDKKHGLFMGFMFGSIISVVTIAVPFLVLIIQAPFSNIIENETTSFSETNFSLFVLNGLIYITLFLVFILMLLNKKKSFEYKKIILILFYIIHYVFGSAIICWIVEYEKYKNRSGGEGQDVFGFHIAVLIASILYPFIGMFFDWIIKLKANKAIEE